MWLNGSCLRCCQAGRHNGDEHTGATHKVDEVSDIHGQQSDRWWRALRTRLTVRPRLLDQRRAKRLRWYSRNRNDFEQPGAVLDTQFLVVLSRQIELHGTDFTMSTKDQTLSSELHGEALLAPDTTRAATTD